MITSGEQVRLTKKEHQQLKGLTSTSSQHIKNRTQLENYVQAHLINYPGRNSEERLLRAMLESFLPG